MREWLKNKRLSKELTQKEIAKLVGISRSTYAMIEKGERNPSVSVAKRIADVLKFDWTIFFEDKCHVLCIENYSA
ncbi:MULTISPECIES: helix-turn-helix transcriptional regulator [unclassified Anoxybacillus]|uniref:helix-turn-helix transcriptional regulator n=1 Tax=unclassified Anoxybacillus TaxID=2639704 RepID=UPI001C63B86E|nr:MULTISPECIES: helix-turn-helix transcriptional regulator [unclassified Anoxybacillus]MCG5024644.1 helix-turn-helix transcriptional regulator [Anoxybacillus flavithermus]MCG6198046.1 helix-turn-helix transcriptional regulator [Anoxybacillus sp. LAT_38]MBW7651340.1 helix-turn-helix transcriptional regulator [Anoxybacillus sp. ST4]MCG3085909.1 helix-turn-helix transcriptional regulator [Anoxybacillus sp. LAT27]MCG6172704.1 helix-turn-helix transcriptional regulator [Anoxybacillus sp. LAT_11]